MIDRSKISVALLVVGAVLLIAPAVAPVQSVLFHDIRGEFTMSESELEERGVTVIAYENLSDRGKELYERSLRNDGHYRAPAGTGASDFEYRADSEEDVRSGFGPRAVAIERPDDPDFPSVDERPVRERRPPDEGGEVGGTGGSEAAGGDTADAQANGTADQPPEPREENEYNLMETRLGQPPLTDGGNLLRFLSILVGVVTVGSGGYLRSRP
ncbi:hypothetical protein BV210_02240 [Halorientalis sp. IM1011]|uniref:hypothetical protein n=1 Tax=Halorientalis sp. IM1011 TaxID=1932360 RepID=UPI00097CD3A2|nr:hypothetical protein [Halorientalis sp. IM1011]AQL41605.1 hypothetical protein BV210_02240 [Halorientalis sp. IM1011]